MLPFGSEDVSLTWAQRRALDGAISAAFTNDELEQMLYYDMEVSLDEITRGASVATVVFKLLQWLERRGRVAEFVRVAYQDNPHNAQLHEVAKSIGLVADAPPKERLTQMLQFFVNEFDMTTDLTQEQQFERMLEAFARDLELRPSTQPVPQLSTRHEVVASAYVDLPILADWLAAAERRVCRLEVEGQMRSTGFLVGPDQVLTVYHAVECVLESGDWGKVRFRFDYVQRNGVISKGETVKLTADQSLLDFSPYSRQDPNPEVDRNGVALVPDYTESGYALLRMDRQIGHERGWFSLAEGDVVQKPTKILILHYPSGDSLKCSFGELLRANNNGTRYEHLTRTEPGSAGAPCFDIYGNLIAMHYAKDSDWKKQVRFGRAVSVSAIRSLLLARGIELT